MNKDLLKKIAYGTVLLSIWFGVCWLLRKPISEIIVNTFSIDPMYDGAKTTLGWKILPLYILRLLLFAFVGASGMGVKYLLKTCSPHSLVPRRYQKMDADSRHPEKNPELARMLYGFVVFLAVIPAHWMPRIAGGCALILIALTMFGIHLIALIGMGEAFGPVVKLDRKKNPEGLYGIAVFASVFFILFLAWHLPSYGVAVWMKTLSFGVARRHLLLLHAWVMWCAMPLYVWGTHDRTIFLNFLRLNLWFLPLPKVLETVQEVRGGLSGGAGATRAI